MRVWWCVCLVLACVVGASADVVPGDRAALVDFYNAAGGAGWRNSTGWNTAAGVCTWFGVTCNADGIRVTELCVAAAARVGAAPLTARSDDDARRSPWVNQLSGTIPSSIGSLTALTVL